MRRLTAGWRRSGSARRLAGLTIAALSPACIQLGVVAPVAASASAGGGGCGPYIYGNVVQVPCSSTSGTAGFAGTGTSTGAGTGAGTGGSTSTSSCATVVYTAAQAQQLGLGQAPAGQAWAELVCGNSMLPGVVVILVSAATGTPQVTPQQLMIQAYGELRVPSLSPATAPPLGHDGLVGLPEWFWVPPAGWHALSITVSTGPVWATVTATPVGLTFEPGAGISPVSCQGPGTAYDPATPAPSQSTDCSYTYLQPSAALPGNVYQASVSITWRIDWVGSGGAGGVLAPALSVPVPLAIPVAQGEALVTTP
jgi:hypothetical protein